MKRQLFAALIIAVAISLVVASYYVLPRPIEQTKTVVIDMTTRQWRFDVLSVNPHDSAKFSTTSATGRFNNLTIIVHEGDTIIMRIKNLDGPHGFGLQAFGVNVVTPPGQTTDVKFVANQTGTFTFFCIVFCGSGHPNHKGTLIVES